ncbi:hypothetical protein J6590_012866 [Homalodisca vitripennis]|nr:hypothetical protein J6590_012866 [Homalodisca vitripennis]
MPGRSVGEDDLNEAQSEVSAPSTAPSQAPSTGELTKPKKKKIAAPVSEEASSDDKPSSPSCLLIGDYAVIRVERKQKKSFQLYVTKVIEVEDDGYVGVFFKKKSNVKKFEETNEEGFFH